MLFMNIFSGVNGTEITQLKAGQNYQVTWHLAYSHKVN